MLLSEAMTRYLNDLTVRRGHYTVRNQTACLKTFAAYFGTLRPEDHVRAADAALTLSQCRAFMATFTRRNLRPKTLKGYVITRRGLVRFLHDEEVLPDDWGLKLQGPRVTGSRADPLTQDEWQHFLNAIPGLTPARLGDRLFFQLLDTGPRLNEIITLSLVPARHPLGPAGADYSPRQERQGPDHSVDGGPVSACESLYQPGASRLCPTHVPAESLSVGVRPSAPSLHHPGQCPALCAPGRDSAPGVSSHAPRHVCHPVGLGPGEPHRDSGAHVPCEYPNHGPLCRNCRERDAGRD